MRLRLTLHRDAKLWHRLWSMRLTILTVIYTSAAGAWATVPDDWRPSIPHGVQVVLAVIGVMLPASAAVARVIDQPKLRQGKPEA